jgi:chromosome segregation ATPase
VEIRQEVAGTRQEIVEIRQEVGGTRHTLTRELADTRQALEVRIDGVERKLDAFREETLGHFDEIYRRLERLETEYHAISAALIRVEKMISEERSDREELKREVESLKSRLAELEKRLADLEAELRDTEDA